MFGQTLTLSPSPEITNYKIIPFPAFLIQMGHKTWTRMEHFFPHLYPSTMIQDSSHTSHVTFISQTMINTLATLMKILTVGKLAKPLTYPKLYNLNFMTLPNIWQLTRSLYSPKKDACLRIKIYRFCHTTGQTTWPLVMLTI